MYVPKAKRRYGHFVLPILHGDRLIGRIDPQMDRRSGTLTVRGIFLEPEAPRSKATGTAVAAVIRELGSWLGAAEVRFGDEIPAAWRSVLPD